MPYIFRFKDKYNKAIMTTRYDFSWLVAEQSRVTVLNINNYQNFL